jgi:hypothetical protein
MYNTSLNSVHLYVIQVVYLFDQIFFKETSFLFMNQIDCLYYYIDKNYKESL